MSALPAKFSVNVPSLVTATPLLSVVTPVLSKLPKLNVPAVGLVVSTIAVTTDVVVLLPAASKALAVKLCDPSVRAEVV